MTYVLVYRFASVCSAAGEVTMSVTVDDYLDKVVDMCNIRLDALAVIKQTEEKHCETDNFRLLKPDLEIKVSYLYDTTIYNKSQ